MNNRNDLIEIIAQAFYGNRTGTAISAEHVDAFILGYLDSTLFGDEEAARAAASRGVIHVPGTKDVVLLYNKDEEAECLEDKERYFQRDGYVLKPLASIPELGVELYSRCIACRMDENGKLQSLQPEDYRAVMQYLAE